MGFTYRAACGRDRRAGLDKRASAGDVVGARRVRKLQPRQSGRQLEQQRHQRARCQSQQQHPDEHEQQLGLPPRELTTAFDYEGSGQLAAV